MIAGWLLRLVRTRRLPKYLWDLKEAPALAGMKPQAMPDVCGLRTPFLGQGRVPLLVRGALLAVLALGRVIKASIWQANGDFRFAGGREVCW
jgi:hypothetical protein